MMIVNLWVFSNSIVKLALSSKGKNIVLQRTPTKKQEKARQKKRGHFLFSREQGRLYQLAGWYSQA